MKCHSCPEEAAPGVSVCPTHREMQRKLAASKRERNRADRRCLDCGVLLTVDQKVACKPCRDTRNVLQKKITTDRKVRCVDLLGGRCVDCGLVSEYTAVYDFHHTDPDGKDFNIGKILTYKWETITLELKKCVLVCANCHRIRHAKEALAVPEIAELISA